MRQIVLDTETTGLSPRQGHRVIEIGCVELVNGAVSDVQFHCYLKPDCRVNRQAVAVHGLTNQFLQDKPVFAEIVDDFLKFITDAELIIHNASFDTRFLDHELSLMNKRNLAYYCHKITDTLPLARRLHPHQENNLDALCQRYQIDNQQRQLHGALLDAQILAEVYLAMTNKNPQTHIAETAPTYSVINTPTPKKKQNTLQTVEAFTDGGCSGNPGAGGWGVLLRYGEKEKHLFDGEKETTNNRMELMAAIQALENLKRPCHVILTTDSQYVRKGITEWIKNWKKNGWRTSKKAAVKNADLWQRLDAATQVHTVEWKWVKGHSGHRENEIADMLAGKGIAKYKY